MYSYMKEQVTSNGHLHSKEHILCCHCLTLMNYFTNLSLNTVELVVRYSLSDVGPEAACP